MVLLQSFDKPHGDHISCNKGSRLLPAAGKEFTRCVHAILIIYGAGINRLLIHSKTRFPHGITIPLITLDIDAVFTDGTADKRDAAVSFFDQIAGCHSGSFFIFDTDCMEEVIFHITVHQHNGNTKGFQGIQVFTRIGAYDDHPVHATVLSNTEIVLVLFCAGNKEMVSMLPGSILNRRKKFAIERVGEHQFLTGLCLRDQDANQVAAAAGKAASVQIRNIS